MLLQDVAHERKLAPAGQKWVCGANSSTVTRTSALLICKLVTRTGRGAAATSDSQRSGRGAPYARFRVPLYAAAWRAQATRGAHAA